MYQTSKAGVLLHLTRLRLVAFLAFLVVNTASWAVPGNGFASVPDSEYTRSAQSFANHNRWDRVTGRSADVEQAEIRTHFANVRRILADDTPASLDTAVTRFEMAYGLSLTSAGRAELRSRLSARRSLQADRLDHYASVGRFPLNRHYADEARPIFVDAQGTHCAVGHLMALDGREAEVLALARSRPNVLVREVDGGPLVAWVLSSGLTQEEAALIQPAYYPPSTAEATTLSTLVVPGTTYDRNGFRYANFAFSAASTGGAAAPSAAQLGLVYGWPTTPAPFQCGGNCEPTPDTLWFGYFDTPAFFSHLQTTPGQSITIDIAYDVAAVAPGLAIGGTRTFASSLYGGFIDWYYPLGSDNASLSTTLDSDVLETLVLDFPSAANEVSGTALLVEPAATARVRHRFRIADGAAFSSFNSVTVATTVPLPGSVGLLGFALAVLWRTRMGVTDRARAA